MSGSNVCIGTTRGTPHVLLRGLIAATLVRLAWGQNATAEPNATSVPTVAPSNATSLPTVAPSNATSTAVLGCFDNTTLLYEEVLRGNPFEQKEYILCPNTEYRIGSFRVDGTCCDDGEFQIAMPSRTTLKCGEDGKSENNCIITGGNIQYSHAGFFVGATLLTGVTIMGLTFQDAKIFSAILTTQGDITFVDCVWRRNVVGETVIISYSPPPPDAARRLSIEEMALQQAPDHINVQDPMERAMYMQSREYVDELLRAAAAAAESWRTAAQSQENLARRQLQADELLNVEFINCTFEENEQGTNFDPSFPILGVVIIPVPRNPTRIENCRFRNNIYDGSAGFSNGYAVNSAGSPLEVVDCCFEGNDFIGFGPVQAFGDAPFSFQNNYASADDLVKCTFAAVSADFAPPTLEDAICIEPDRDSCDGEDPGTPKPTPVPTTTSAPTSNAADTKVVWRVFWALVVPFILTVPALVDIT